MSVCGRCYALAGIAVLVAAGPSFATIDPPPDFPVGDFVPGSTAVAPTYADTLEGGGALVRGGGRNAAFSSHYERSGFGSYYSAGYPRGEDLFFGAGPFPPVPQTQFAWTAVNAGPQLLRARLKSRVASPAVANPFDVGSDGGAGYVFSVDDPGVPDDLPVTLKLTLSTTATLVSGGANTQLGFGVEFFEVINPTTLSPLLNYQAFVVNNGTATPFVSGMTSADFDHLVNGVATTNVHYTRTVDVQVPQGEQLFARKFQFTAASSLAQQAFNSDSSNTYIVEFAPGAANPNLTLALVPEPSLAAAACLTAAALLPRRGRLGRWIANRQKSVAGSQ